MNLTVQRVRQTDEQVVERARRVVASKGRLRWGMLLYAAVFLGMCGYFTVVGIHKTENLEQLSMGFVYGLAMAVVWLTFGVMGGLFLGKFIAGFQRDFRLQELLVSYHDCLRDLGRLPERAGKQGGPANRSQPTGSETNGTSSAAGSGG